MTLFSYPDLFGVADNNPYGLKVFAFLKLCGLPFRHQHVFDTTNAPRAQLPYIVDDGQPIGDSDLIISHLIRRYGLALDDGLTTSQRDTDLLVRRALDDCIGSCRTRAGRTHASGRGSGMPFGGPIRV